MGRSGNEPVAGISLAVRRWTCGASPEGAGQRARTREEERRRVRVRFPGDGSERAGEGSAWEAVGARAPSRPGSPPLSCPTRSGPSPLLLPSVSPLLVGRVLGRKASFLGSPLPWAHHPLVPPSLRSRTPFPLDPVTHPSPWPPSRPLNPLAEEPRWARWGPHLLPTQGHQFCSKHPFAGTEYQASRNQRGREAECLPAAHSLQSQEVARPPRGLHPVHPGLGEMAALTSTSYRTQGHCHPTVPAVVLNDARAGLPSHGVFSLRSVARVAFGEPRAPPPALLLWL